MNLAATYIIFFISGISGLIYQVIWVRCFGNIFGNTIYSSAVVTSVFMCGLGIGSYVAGRIADRFEKNPLVPLKMYSISEILIGALGFGVSFVLRLSEKGIAAFSAYEVDKLGWHELTFSSYFIRYTAAALLLLPMTLLMGGTLTLLIRYLLTFNLKNAGKRIGLLYGFNTAGAALGCLLVDFVLVPYVGINSTQQIAVFFNLLAGLGAWLLFRRLENHSRPSRTEEKNAAKERSPEKYTEATRNLVIGTGLAIALSGVAGMGIEIVWYRYIISAIGQLRSVFSLLLAVILIGIWIGSVAAGYLTQWLKRPKLLYAFSLLGFVIATLLAFKNIDVSDSFTQGQINYGQLSYLQRQIRETWMILFPIIKLVGLPALFMGSSFPLANAIAQNAESTIGRRAGALYLSNTAGAVLGSLLAGFYLIPQWGMKGGVFFCCLAALAALIPLSLSSKKEKDFNWKIISVPALVAVGLLFMWMKIPDDFLIMQSFRAKGTVEGFLRAPSLIKTSEGLTESIVIMEIPADAGGRRLYTNGHLMSGSAPGSQRYMRAMVHIPMLHMTNPKKVLVICFGVGTTLNAASLYPSVSHLEIVDLSKHILEQSEYFSGTNGHILKDPRVSVFVNDGRQHLVLPREDKYDLITLEPPPISFAGVSALYSEEFYKMASDNLQDGGYLTQWLPIKELPGSLSRSLIRSFVDVFPNAVLLAGSYGEFILMGRKGGQIQFDPDLVQKNLQANDRVREDMEKYYLADMTELAGSFLADAATLVKAVKDDPPVTDDDPSMEYAQILYITSLIPTEIVDHQHAQAWCPKCFRDGNPTPAFSRLNRYMNFLGAMYKDPSFSYIGPFEQAKHHVEHVPMSFDDFKDVVDHSPYLKHLMGNFEFRAANFL